MFKGSRGFAFLYRVYLSCSKMLFILSGYMLGLDQVKVFGKCTHPPPWFMIFMTSVFFKSAFARGTDKRWRRWIESKCCFKYSGLNQRVNLPFTCKLSFCWFLFHRNNYITKEGNFHSPGREAKKTGIPSKLRTALLALLSLCFPPSQAASL